jgi:hypothetical protein
MSYALLLLAVFNFALLIWAVRACRRDPANLALMLQTVLLALLWFDAGTVAVGRWLGDGEPLLTMSRIRYTWFFLTMPLLLIASAALARQAGFAVARPRFVLPLLAAVAVLFMVRDVPMAWTADYHTACFADTLRHVFKVAAGEACRPEDAGLGGGGFSPAIPLVFASVTLVGLALWLRRGWPWLGAAALLFMATTLVPASIVGPFLTYPADTLMTAAFLVTARKFPPRAGA